MTKIERIVLDLVTGSQFEALSDKDLAAVYMEICNRKTTGGKTRDQMLWAAVGASTAYRRRYMRKMELSNTIL